MIKYVDILKAVNNKLKVRFPTIPIPPKGDVKEKIDSPSFMTTLDRIQSSNFMDICVDRQMTIRIYYFPSDSDKNRIENFNMIDSLNEIFVEDNIIQVNEDFFIEVFKEIDVDIVDKVVHYYIPISISEETEKINDTPIMENLQYDQ